MQQSFRSRRNICAAVFRSFFPQYLCAAFSCIFKSNSICPYISYQDHAGLQPANLVTTYISVHSRDLSVVRHHRESSRRFSFRTHAYIIPHSRRCWDIHSGDPSLGFILGIRVWDSFESGIHSGDPIRVWDSWHACTWCYVGNFRLRMDPVRYG